MSSEYSVLETHSLPTDQMIASPVFLPLLAYLDDDAVEVMLDYDVITPIVVDSEQPMFKTRQTLEQTGMQLALVHDAHHKLLGALSLQQILSEQTIKLIEENRVLRKEVQTKNVMTLLADIPVIELNQLKLAKVGHVLATLEKLKKPYILVVESLTDNKPIKIRGAFIVSHIAKMIGKPVFIHTNSEATVAELQHKLHR
jgi:hypothetical protein